MIAAPARTIPEGPPVGLTVQVTLLAVLSATVGLGAAGLVAGLACAVTMTLALAGGLARRPGERLGPASWVTLARGTLAVGLAALAPAPIPPATPRWPLGTLAALRPSPHASPLGLRVTLAPIALALDTVDGAVARRTGTASPLGARFDGEVDALL